MIYVYKIIIPQIEPFVKYFFSEDIGLIESPEPITPVRYRLTSREGGEPYRRFALVGLEPTHFWVSPFRDRSVL